MYPCKLKMVKFLLSILKNIWRSNSHKKKQINSVFCCGLKLENYFNCFFCCHLFANITSFRGLLWSANLSFPLNSSLNWILFLVFSTLLQVSVRYLFPAFVEIWLSLVITTSFQCLLGNVIVCSILHFYAINRGKILFTLSKLELTHPYWQYFGKRDFWSWLWSVEDELWWTFPNSWCSCPKKNE